MFNKKIREAAATTAILSIIFVFAGCSQKPFDGPQKLGGQWVSSKKLNLGWETYNNYCMQCHGMNGDGKGPAAQGMVPHPRDFTQGEFKFGYAPLGDLPSDEDFARIIRHGLNGTPMLPWDISDNRLSAVIQYIKTFSPAWKEGQSGTAVEFTKDPWKNTSDAIVQGKKVYHGLAQCYTCHPSYASLEEISAASMELTESETEEIRENSHLSIIHAQD